MSYIGAIYECVTGDDWVAGHLVEGTSKITVFSDSGASYDVVPAISQYDMLSIPRRTGVLDADPGLIEPQEGRGYTVGNLIFWFFGINGTAITVPSGNPDWSGDYVIYRVLVLNLLDLTVKVITPISDSFCYLPNSRTPSSETRLVNHSSMIGSDGKLYIDFMTQSTIMGVRNKHYLATVGLDGITNTILLPDMFMNGLPVPPYSNTNWFEFPSPKPFWRIRVIDGMLAFPIVSFLAYDMTMGTNGTEGHNAGFVDYSLDPIVYIQYLNPLTGGKSIQPTGYTFQEPSDVTTGPFLNQIDYNNLLDDSWSILYDAVNPAYRYGYDQFGTRYGYFSDLAIANGAWAMNTDNYVDVDYDLDFSTFVIAMRMWKRGMDAVAFQSQSAAVDAPKLFPELGDDSSNVVDVRVYAINGGRYVRSLIYRLGGTAYRRRLTMYQSYEAIRLAMDNRDPGQLLRDEAIRTVDPFTWDDWAKALAFVGSDAVPFKRFWDKFRLTAEKE